MSSNKLVTDAQIDKDELDAMAAPPYKIGVAAGYCASKQYVEQQQNDDGETTVTIHGELVITDGENEVNVSDFIKTMQDRMLILQPNLEAMEEYPALKDAYDQYKMLEKLLTEGNKNAEKD